TREVYFNLRIIRVEMNTKTPMPPANKIVIANESTGHRSSQYAKPAADQASDGRDHHPRKRQLSAGHRLAVAIMYAHIPRTISRVPLRVTGPPSSISRQISIATR